MFPQTTVQIESFMINVVKLPIAVSNISVTEDYMDVRVYGLVGETNVKVEHRTFRK